MKKIKNLRLPNYNYASNGYYFITIATNYRHPYLNEYKELVSKNLKKLSCLQGVQIDYYEIMGNHLHSILILEDSVLDLGEIVRRFKAITTREAGLKLWQPNYYEHVIRNKMALYRIREYIQNNPEIEKVDFEQFYNNKRNHKIT